ncbi:MAG: HAMP domain-containing histidine kinase [Lachnospiraceae bacterium]|nr:HAMP domain-containing histidine kinase [Lachnospiraceae bacterium]
MKKLICKKPVRVLLILLGAAAAGILFYCLATVSFWMEDSFSLSEFSRSYEQSELFFRQVDTVLSNKIKGQDNARLLETDGELDLEKQIDIQSYDTVGNTVQDMNTTYLLGDLLNFYENGGWQALHDAITAAAGDSTRDTGEILDEQSDTLETITPVTGITLAECSRWYSDPAGYVEEMYTLLCEACEDIYAHYVEYTTVQDESWSAKAPSNLLYYIENTSNGEVYTNISADSYEEAVAAAEAEEAFTSLYEGERSFNIMVTNPDRVLNAEASEWFLQERFVGTNEKIYLAVDTSYPVSDELQTWSDYYAQRETIVWRASAGAAFSLVLLLFCFLCSAAAAGQKEEDSWPMLLRIDSVPTELAAGVYLIALIIYALIVTGWQRVAGVLPGEEKLKAAVVAASAYLVFLSAVLAFIRRFRAKTLWSNSVTRTLLVTWRQVNSSRAASGQLIVLYIAFFVLNFLFLLLFGRVGLVLVVLLDIAVLLYLMRDMAGKQSIYEGIHQISQGDLNYRIDTGALQGDSRKMAEAVNEMGESLCGALEAIVKNERLKAELITNVSHDLKTPLTSIVNYVDLLKRETLLTERARGYIEVLDQKSQRLKQLTEDLVEASKISSGNIELDIVRLQVQSMLMQACGEFEERLEEHGLTTMWQLEKEPVFIMADGRQLWRILENLLGNVCKYAKEHTEVRVTLRRGSASDVSVPDRSGNVADASVADRFGSVADVSAPDWPGSVADIPVADRSGGASDVHAQDLPRSKSAIARKLNYSGNAASGRGFSLSEQEIMIEIRNVSRDQINVEVDELTGRFVRGDASRSTEGSGLGLSIAQNLTELLDGRFELSLDDGFFAARMYFSVAPDSESSEPPQL